MPSQREEEPRRRRKDYDRDSSTRKKDYDRESSSRTSTRDKDGHKSSKKTHRRRSSTSRVVTPNRSASASRLDTSSPSDMAAKPAKKVTMVVPEMERRSSTGTGLGSASYPTFSKQHSREAVHSLESVPLSKTRVSSFGTGTDIPRPRSAHDTLESDFKTTTSHPDFKTTTPTQPSECRASSAKPPSPPLTEEERETNRARAASERHKTTDKLKDEFRKTRKSSADSLRPSSSASQKSKTFSYRRIPDDSDGSEVSQRSPDKSKHSDSTGISKTSYRARETSSDEQAYHPSSSVTQHTQDSQATEKKSDRRPSSHAATRPFSPSSQPVPSRPLSASRPVQPPTPASGQYGNQESYNGPHRSSTAPHPPSTPSTIPPPPPGSMPPPPPPIIPPEVNPRVDYLLENGGLPRPTARTLLPRVTAQQPQSWNAYASPRLNPGSAPSDLAQMFAPVHARLQDYMRVIEKNGSIAVATGYRSVARRLLDRVATVFAREISNERCQCVMCSSLPAPDMSDEEEKGISWGEILEFTVGRRELPQWPPFTMTGPIGSGLTPTGAEPMQKIDPDVPPEWRDHYLRQNAKVKRAVEGWLLTSDDAPTSAPAEVDDETLTFAITTHIQPERRPIFIALKRGLAKLPSPGIEPPPADNDNKNDVLGKVATALQRLYRLLVPPREAECCLYLLDNAYLHNTLATIAAVTDSEWDILVSGRFDGFLVSGAETQMPSSAGAGTSNIYAPSRGPSATPLSRTTTPFSPLRNVSTSTPDLFPSRTTTPFSAAGGMTPAPAPVQVDEDTEISVLAEIEREILRGMEELEDQFEKLHSEAEGVRERLRSRAAGLALMARARRRSEDVGISRWWTPDGWGGYGAGGRASVDVRGWTPGELESVFDDGRSELAPDDSASQIGGHGGASKRREHRRDGRMSRDGRGSRAVNRTPAPVAEVDEGDPVGAGAEKVGGEKEKKSGLFGRRW